MALVPKPPEPKLTLPKLMPPGPFDRYNGDLANGGQGEILIAAPG